MNKMKKVTYDIVDKDGEVLISDLKTEQEAINKIQQDFIDPTEYEFQDGETVSIIKVETIKEFKFTQTLTVKEIN